MSALKASLGMGAMPNRWANDESMLRRAFLRWRALVAAALLALALGTALFATGRGQRSLPASASPAVQMDGSAVEPSGRLPRSLRGPVSRTLGAAGEAYRVGTIGGALGARASPSAQALRAWA